MDNPLTIKKEGDDVILTECLREAEGDIIIPKGVTKIEKYAFSHCHKLSSILIQDSVIEICAESFYMCDGLTSIVIPNSVKYIGRSAFRKCESLSSLVIPSSVIKIEEAAFSDCENINSIVVDDDNPVYDSRNNCNAIIETNTNKLIAGCSKSFIPNTVKIIDNQAFAGCHNLSSITIPDSVTAIGKGTFVNCGLTSIIIPKSVISIGDSAFCGCRKLTSVTIPTNVTKMGKSVFNGCIKLK